MNTNVSLVLKEKLVYGFVEELEVRKRIEKYKDGKYLLIEVKK